MEERATAPRIRSRQASGADVFHSNPGCSNAKKQISRFSDRINRRGRMPPSIDGRRHWITGIAWQCNLQRSFKSSKRRIPTAPRRFHVIGWASDRTGAYSMCSVADPSSQYTMPGFFKSIGVRSRRCDPRGPTSPRPGGGAGDQATG